MSAHPTDAVTRFTKYDELPEWLSITEVATWQHLSVSYVSEQIRTGKLRAVKMGRVWRVPKDALAK
jgi:excisionase family DNA binding protein